MVENWLIVGAFVLAIAFLFFGRSSSPTFQAGTITAPVSRVVDGDTFYLKGEATRFRIWAINAPELDEKGGQRAARYLRNLTSSKPLRCEIRGKDRYGRHVARCFLPDGRDIAFDMITAGHAVELRQYSKGYYSQ